MKVAFAFFYSFQVEGIVSFFYVMVHYNPRHMNHQCFQMFHLKPRK